VADRVVFMRDGALVHESAGASGQEILDIIKGLEGTRAT
jgi:hypothetical protein